jgi:hypothetical protein
MAAQNHFASALLGQGFASGFQAHLRAGFHPGLHCRPVFFLAAGGLEGPHLII